MFNVILYLRTFTTKTYFCSHPVFQMNCMAINALHVRYFVGKATPDIAFFSKIWRTCDS